MEDKTEIILAQWQTCVEMANSVSQRRDTMNNIFVTLNLAIVAAVTITWDLKSVFILLAGVLISVLWCMFIKNYKMLNREKFYVINELEKKLPEKPFCDEWERLQKNKEYKDGTKLERILPMMFVILYLIAIVTIIIMKIKTEGGM